MSNAIANQLFLAYLGRPADTQWRNTTGTLLNGAAPSAALQTAFYNAAVADGVFAATDSPSVLVNKIFNQLFGFAASTFEQNAWGNLITTGVISAQTAAWTIFSSYLGATNVPDSYKIPAQSKLIAADAYVTQLANDPAANAALSQAGSAAATSARTFLTTITTQAQAATAVTGIATTVASLGTATTGQTFTLTTSPDNITGTTGNDVINGFKSATGGTLSATDVINGGAGTDTLNITVDEAGNVLAGALISNVEVVGIRATGNVAVTLDAAGLTGVTLTGTNTSTTGLSNLATGVTATVGASANLTGAITAGYAAAATTASLAYTGGTSGGVSFTGAGLTTANIASSSAANTGATISSAVTGLKTWNITASSNLTLTAIDTAGTTGTLNVSGTAASVNVGTLDTDFTTVNASGLTAGGLTATMSGTATTTLTGGAGNDVITTGVALTTGSVAAGAGSADRLVVAASAHLNTAALGAKYTGFEQLQVNTGVTVDLDNISGITSVRINDVAGATGLTNLSAAQAAAVTVVGADGADGAVTIGVKNATNVGQIDTVAITADDGASTTGTIALGTPVMNGVEKLTINAVDNVTIGALTSATSLDTITLSGAGTIGITTGANSTANFAINGSAATGVLTLDASGYATNGVALTGGSAADTLTGSNQADIIVGGAGADSITGGQGADTLTGGDGVDTFVMLAATINTGNDTITDFTVGSSGDRIDLGFLTIPTALTSITMTGTATVATNNIYVVNYGGAIGTTDFSGATGFATLFGAGKALGTTVATTDDFMVVVQGTDRTVILAYENPAATTLANTDVDAIVTLTGVTSSSTFVIDNFI
jgi:hypothetical protein